VTYSANADCAAARVGGKCGFAGKRDWRVPNVKELQSIVNYEVFDPSVSAAFNTGCVPGATVLDGSCTRSSIHWSSTSFASIPFQSGALNAWFVNFANGFVDPAGKRNFLSARAVRGGL